MMKLKRIGHVLLSVADIEASKRFYRDALGFRVAEEEPDHGGVFMTLGDNFHTLDIVQHPHPDAALHPQAHGAHLGLIHIAFEVESYAGLREAYLHLQKHGVALRRATNHVNQRSLYFADPDGNGIEIYYEVPHALQLFPDGREDLDEALPVTKPGEKLPAWLDEDWPPPALKAKIAQYDRPA
jgi:catechol-2,3-dioxygenase